jgi:predicted RNase H-like HicB family nuclease
VHAGEGGEVSYIRGQDERNAGAFVGEWPEVVTEGTDLEDCRDSLRDAVEQMVLAYREQGQEIPLEHGE